MPIDNLSSPIVKTIKSRALPKSTTLWVILAAVTPIIVQYCKGEIDLTTMISAIVVAIAGIHSTARRLNKP